MNRMGTMSKIRKQNKKNPKLVMIGTQDSLFKIIPNMMQNVSPRNLIVMIHFFIFVPISNSSFIYLNDLSIKSFLTKNNNNMNNADYHRILKMAIQNEIEAYEFYLSASLKAKSDNLKGTFRELAEEELNHKRTLEGFVMNESLKLNFKASTSDYKIAESTELPPLTSDMSFAEGIALAMKKEEEAMLMYQGFADAIENQNEKEVFLQLAIMEQGHKVRLENIYTNAAYTEVW